MRFVLINSLFFSLCILGTAGLWAQDVDLKNSLRLAERFKAEGNYIAAADQYVKAWSAKPRKTAYAHQAAEFYFLTKEYDRAAEYYKIVARDYKAFPLAGLNYARSLKQAGRFDQATAAYIAYLADYTLDDRQIIEQIVETEVKGTEMARQEAVRFQDDLIVTRLNSGVNTPDHELGPMPLGENVLYYLSNRRQLTRMYRSDFDGTTWLPGKLAEQFPIVPGKHIGSGALSPLGDRFYFTLCEADAFMARPTATCAIHVIVKSEAGWSKPQPLPGYINTEGNTTTTPYVYQDGELEVLLFSSDRLDGYGGLDLYRSERYLDSEDTDFSFPESLGPVVNSVGDETTPFYEERSKTLYFSSNGYISMGGFDVFSTQGDGSSWNEPRNLRAPTNSPADDYYYRKIPGSQTAFLTSNRAFLPEKTRTSDEDIYMLKPGRPSIPVALQIIDSSSSTGLRDVVLAAFSLGDSGRQLIASEMSEDGYFELRLPIGIEVELDVQCLDYHRKIQSVTIPVQQRKGYQLPPLRMSRIVLPLADVQRIEAEREGAPVSTIPSTQTSKQTPVVPADPTPTVATPTEPPSRTLPPNSIRVNQQANTPAERTPEPEQPVVQTNTSPQSPSVGENSSTRSTPASGRQVPRQSVGTTYRVQIEARRNFSADHPRYDALRSFGMISSDYISSKDLHRVLVGEYYSLSEAKTALREIKNNGWGNAFVARLSDGVYKGMVYK